MFLNLESLLCAKFGLASNEVIEFWLSPYFFSLEERQRAERRTRETKGLQHSPRWFDPSSEIAPTPWGDLEVYRYNGKYDEYRAAMDSSDNVEEIDIGSTEFNPWQYANLATEWDIHHVCLPLHVWFPFLFSQLALIVLG